MEGIVVSCGDKAKEKLGKEPADFEVIMKKLERLEDRAAEIKAKALNIKSSPGDQGRPSVPTPGDASGHIQAKINQIGDLLADALESLRAFI